MDPAAYVTLLRKCRVTGGLSDGKRIHKCIIKSGLHGNTFLENNLLQLYSDYGASESALDLFTNMRERNQFSWNFMIRAYARQQQRREAVDLFQQMHEEAVLPDKFIFASMLSACSNYKAVTEGKRIHACIVGSGLEADVVVGTALVSMYGKQTSIDTARWLFNNLPDQNMVSWNAIVTVYAHGGQVNMAIQLYEQMLQEGILTDKVAFVSVLHACASQSAVKEGKRMHACLKGRRFERDIVVVTALVSMYGKCGSVENARWMFDEMTDRNAFSWTAMISACAQGGQGENSLQLYRQMQQEGLVGDKVTFVSILDACACDSLLLEGKFIHACIAGSALEVDVVVGTALVNMYAKCGEMLDAQRMFAILPKPNEVAWNALITANVRTGHIEEAFQLCGQMQQEGLIPHKLAIASILCGCESEGSVAKGRQSHSFILTCGLEVDVMIGTALVNTYGKCGWLEDADWVFDTLSERSVASWTAMIAVHSCAKDVHKSFEQMQQEGLMPERLTFKRILDVFGTIPPSHLGKQIHARIVCCEFNSDMTLGTALVNMYGRWGSFENAWTVFDQMLERNLVCWNSIIAAYSQNGQITEALRLFQQMQQEGIVADKVTFFSILAGCAREAALAKGKHMHACMVGHGFPSDVLAGTTLINMYGKCGSIDNAQLVFNELATQNLFSCTSMITVYAQHGQGNNALLLLERIQQLRLVPDKAMYVNLLLACGHAGMVGDAYDWFFSMTGNDAIPVVDHMNCMIDLLGRAGQLDEAENLIKNMPVQPTAISWTILLDACKRLLDGERIIYAAKHVFELDQGDALACAVLTNL